MPQTIEYVTARFPEGRIEKVTGRKAALTRVDNFVDGSRLRLRTAGRNFGRWRDEQDGERRVKDRSLTMPTGEKLIVQRESDSEQLALRKVEELVVPDLHAAPMLELVRAEIVDEFGLALLRDGGLWYCRFVDNSSTVSKHGFKEKNGAWLGAADDLFVKSGGMAQLEEVADFTAGRLIAHEVNGAHVIVNRRILTVGSNGNQFVAYGGVPHYHEHFDVPAGVPCSP